MPPERFTSATRKRSASSGEERQLPQNGQKPEGASFEVQILVLGEEYDALSSGLRGSKLSPAQAGQEVVKRAQGHYDSMIVNAFANLFAE